MDRTDLTVIDGDARIADTHIQQVLGYGRINDLHRVIEKHLDELNTYGEVFTQTSAKPAAGEVFRRSAAKPSSGSKGGRPTLTYYLNEAQATLICMFSRTERAASARKLIVEVFTAWRRGELPEMPAPAVDPFAAMAARTGHVRDQMVALAEMPALAREITHMPVWSNGRRPDWWDDYELRTYLTESHRQMTLAKCCAEVQRRFNRPFSASVLQRYWAILDRVYGPDDRATPRPPKHKKEAA